MPPQSNDCLAVAELPAVPQSRTVRPNGRREQHETASLQRPVRAPRKGLGRILIPDYLVQNPDVQPKQIGVAHSNQKQNIRAKQINPTETRETPRGRGTLSRDNETNLTTIQKGPEIPGVNFPT